MDTSMIIILSSKGIETFNRVMHIYDKGSSIVVNVGSIPSANHYQWIELLKAWFIFLFFGLLCFNSLNLWVRVIDPIQLFIYLSIHFNLQILNLFFTFWLFFIFIFFFSEKKSQSTQPTNAEWNKSNCNFSNSIRKRELSVLAYFESYKSMTFPFPFKTIFNVYLK